MPEESAADPYLQSGRESIELNGAPHVEKPREESRIHRRGDPAFEQQEEQGDEQDDQQEGPSEDEKQEKKKPDSGGRGSPDKEDKKSDDDDEEDPRPIYKRPLFWIAIVVVLIGGIIGLIFWLHARHYESTDDAFIEGHVVQIAPQVSARVAKVYVDDNYHVKAGDPLFDLDPTDYQVALDQARGNENAAHGQLEQAKAQVAATKAALEEAKASLEAASVNFTNADRDLKRFEALDERARSQQQYDNAVTAQKNAAAEVAQAKARVTSAQAQIAVAEANVANFQGQYETAVANRKRAEVNLGYCNIRAPVDGRVTTKNVEPGMYASTATPMLALVQDDVWVVANYKETQLTDMKLGQAVSIKVDAYPDIDFQGQIDSIQMGTGARFSVLPAENATGNYVKVVQRVPVKITFKNPPQIDKDRVLSPGMSVVPYTLVR